MPGATKKHRGHQLHSEAKVVRPQRERPGNTLPEAGAAGQRSTQSKGAAVHAGSPLPEVPVVWATAQHSPSRRRGARDAPSTRLGPRFPQRDGGGWEEAVRSGLGGAVGTSGPRAPQQVPHRLSECQRRFRRHHSPLPEVLPAVSGLEKFGKCARVAGYWRRGARESVSSALPADSEAAAAGATVPKLCSPPPPRFLLNRRCFFQASVTPRQGQGHCCHGAYIPVEVTKRKNTGTRQIQIEV